MIPCRVLFSSLSIMGTFTKNCRLITTPVSLLMCFLAFTNTWLASPESQNFLESYTSFSFSAMDRELCMQSIKCFALAVTASLSDVVFLLSDRKLLVLSSQCHLGSRTSGIALFSNLDLPKRCIQNTSLEFAFHGCTCSGGVITTFSKPCLVIQSYSGTAALFPWDISAQSLAWMMCSLPRSNTLLNTPLSGSRLANINFVTSRDPQSVDPRPLLTNRPVRHPPHVDQSP
mmetsp:Transcript_86516/g.143926  ORF Transcript_86516/g.143926 Transcript_86516/m.143926 type:complete len:230 (+) Transcript_86516:1397-2086(+)